jgi:hypothetical protein
VGGLTENCWARRDRSLTTGLGKWPRMVETREIRVLTRVCLNKSPELHRKGSSIGLIEAHRMHVCVCGVWLISLPYYSGHNILSLSKFSPCSLKTSKTWKRGENARDFPQIHIQIHIQIPLFCPYFYHNVTCFTRQTVGFTQLHSKKMK